MQYSIKKADSGKDAKKVKQVKPDAIVKDGFNENISITNSQEKLQSIMTEKEGKELKFSVGNETNTEIRYAIIALKDWEQVAVRDNTDVLYTTVPPETRHLFDFNLPDVERENNFQLIAFPFPYEVMLIIMRVNKLLVPLELLFKIKNKINNGKEESDCLL